MACNNTYKPVLKQETCDRMTQAYPQCAKMIKNCYAKPSVFSCLPASYYCNRKLVQPYYSSGQNPYDVRTKCEGNENNLCYPILDAVQKYSNRPDVKRELGVDDNIEFK
jgi:cathepsin A (carboxypeptidase C)